MNSNDYDLILQNYSVQEILDLLGLNNYINKSDYFILPCPFHNEKDPSFSIRKSDGVYNCFGCKEKGNLLTLIKKITGIAPFKFLSITKEQSFDYKYNYIKSNNIKDQVKKQDKESKINHFRIIGDIHHPYDIPESKEYCIKRRLDKEDIDKYEIFYISSGFIGLMNYSKRLVIPIKNKENKIVGYEGRDITCSKDIKKCLYNKTSTVGSTIFNYSNLDYNKDIIWTEGFFDFLCTEKALKLYNIKDVQVSTYFGNQFTNTQLNILKKFKKNHILFFDNDKGGQEGIDMLEEKEPDLEFDVMLLTKENEDPGKASYEDIYNAYINKISKVEYYLKKYNILQENKFNWC